MLAKKILTSFLILSTLVVCLFSVTNTYWKKTFPYTHDGENHLARFASYKLALREGHIPPRISPNLHNRYGYPVFNFNYPLANILSLPFSALKINYETIFSLQVVFATTLAWLGIFYGMKLAKKSLMESLLFAGIYTSTPYLTMALIFRGSIGEIWAYSLLPWLWVSTFWIKNFHDESTNTNTFKNENLIQKLQSFLIINIWTSFLLSHNVAILLSIPLMVSIAWVTFGANIKYYLTAVYFGLISFLLTAWFWIPALLEKNQIVLSDATLSNQYFSHFLSFDSLLFSPLTFGYSMPGHSNTMAPNLGLPLVLLSLYLLSVFSLYVLRLILTYCFKNQILIQKLNGLKTKFSPLKNNRVPLIFIMTGLIAFFTLPSSEFFVKYVPFIDLIQFPWRWLLIFPLGLVVSFSLTGIKLPKTIALLLAIALLIQLVIVARTVPADTFHKSNEDYEYYTMSTSTMNENVPKTFLFTEIYDWQATPTVFSLTGEQIKNAEVSVLLWAGTKRTYQITTNTPITVIEPTMYFSGWETNVRDLQTNTSKKIEYLDSKEIAGRLAFSLEPGKYEISSRFTQNTIPRKLGNTLSALTIIFCIAQIGQVIVSNLDNMKTRNRTYKQKIKDLR